MFVFRIQAGDHGDGNIAGRRHGDQGGGQVKPVQFVHHGGNDDQIRQGAHDQGKGFKGGGYRIGAVAAFVHFALDGMGRGAMQHDQHGFHIAGFHIAHIEADLGRQFADQQGRVAVHGDIAFQDIHQRIDKNPDIFIGAERHGFGIGHIIGQTVSNDAQQGNAQTIRLPLYGKGGHMDLADQFFRRPTAVVGLFKGNIHAAHIFQEVFQKLLAQLRRYFLHATGIHAT